MGGYNSGRYGGRPTSEMAMEVWTEMKIARVISAIRWRGPKMQRVNFEITQIAGYKITLYPGPRLIPVQRRAMDRS
jgi:hypothetical protein